MYWNTRSGAFYGKTNKIYVVVKHPLRFFGNNYVSGLKFCNGYTVVEKDSKAYRELKKNSMFKKHKEFELAFLQKLGFRTKDIELIFGKDVFYHYLDAIGLDKFLRPVNKIKDTVEEQVLLEPSGIVEQIEITEKAEKSEETGGIDTETEIPQLTIEEISQAHAEIGLCPHIKPTGTVCESKSSKGSPSGYCFGHIRYDIKLKEQNSEEE